MWKLIAKSGKLTPFEELIAEAHLRALNKDIDLDNLDSEKLDNEEFNKIIDEVMAEQERKFYAKKHTTKAKKPRPKKRKNHHRQQKKKKR